MQEDTHQNKNFEEPPSWGLVRAFPGQLRVHGHRVICRFVFGTPSLLCHLLWVLALHASDGSSATSHRGTRGPSSGTLETYVRGHVCTSVCMPRSCGLHASSSWQDKTTKNGFSVGDLPSSQAEPYKTLQKLHAHRLHCFLVVASDCPRREA